MTQPGRTLGCLLALIAFTDKAFRFVKFSGGAFTTCAAGESGLGVIQDEPLADQPGNIMLSGITLVKLGGTVTAKDPIASDANGKGVKAAAGQFVFGEALDSGVSGDLIRVLLRHNENEIIVVERVMPAVATATDATNAVHRARKGTITSVKYVAASTITGANTNSRTFSLINKSTDGTGTTVIATKAFTSGVNATAQIETDITVSVTAADLNVSEGDILALLSDSIGTGIADPGGLLIITYKRRIS
ncbi:MAG: hypothetical protein WA584_23405 [Pyrinomonadaceae bacterium]